MESDYRELIGSPLGERILRNLLEDLIVYSEAEDYELARVLKRVEERTTAETEHRLALGFVVLDMAVSLQVLRGSVIDVLIDALVTDEMPSFADSLDQLKVADTFIDLGVRHHGSGVIPGPPRGPSGRRPCWLAALGAETRGRRVGHLRHHFFSPT